MSNYTKATNFATKDTLPTGDSNKIVKGTEIDNEFNSISGAISSKADIASPTFTGTPAAPTATAGSNTTQVANTAYVRGELTTLIPSGIILLWSGSIASIPSGWVLCNGANSTPDLRDRFVVGAGSTYAVGATGGANTVTLDSTMIPSHTHSLSASGTTAASGAHTHTVSASGTTSGQSVGHTHTGTTGNNNVGHTHTFSGTTSGQSVTHTHAVSDPSHAHVINAQNQGSTDSHLNDDAVSNSFSGTANGNQFTQNATTGITVGNASADHTHTYSGTTSEISANHVHSFTTDGVSSDHTHTVTVTGTTGDISATHTHTVTVTGTSGGTGGGLAHENRPPYYALAYIMKT
jgi:microcystin-dependent protein